MKRPDYVLTFRCVLSGLALATTLLALGCQGQKIVARVNSSPITDTEFNERVIRVTPNEFPQGGNFDAGGVTLISMIVEKINSQYAADKNWTPSKEDVQNTVNYLLKSNALLRSAINSGRFEQEDVNRRVRAAMIEFAIGTNGAKADPAELDTLYKQRVATMTVPEAYIVQMLPVQDEAMGNRALEVLKRTGDFKAAAIQSGIPPQIAMTAGQETPLPLKNLAPASRAELDKMPDGKLTEKPLKLALVNPSQTATVVLKKIRKEPEYVPKLDEVKFLLSQEVITKKQPQWQAFKNQQLAEATRKAEIIINVKRYEYLRDVIKAQAEQNALGGLGTAPPGGAPPPTGGATSSPSGNAPPTSGASSAPPGGAPPSSSGAPAPGGNR